MGSIGLAGLGYYIMQTDLVFLHQELEARFQHWHRRSKHQIVVRFALYRSAACAFLAVRAALAGDARGAALLLPQVASSFLPVLACAGKLGR